MQFEVNNAGVENSIFLTVVVLVSGILLSLFAIRDRKESIDSLFFKGMIVLLVIYFFKVEFQTVYFWSIWSIFPFNLISGKYTTENWTSILYQSFAYLSVLATFLFGFVVPIFIQKVNQFVTNKSMAILNWVPVINFGTISLSLFRNNIGVVITSIWFLSVSLWFYYKFVSLILLFYFYTDTISFIRRALFPETIAEENQDFSSVIMNVDMVNIMTPLFLFIAMILMVYIYYLLVKKDKKEIMGRPDSGILDESLTRN